MESPKVHDDPVDCSESHMSSHSSTNTGFNVENVYSAFVSSLRQSNNLKSAIGTQDYINGYRELLK